MYTRQKLVEQIKAKQSFLCVGLDTDITKIPKHLLNEPNPVLAFNKAIIDATAHACVSYKINTAFFEAMGADGWNTMAQTISYIPKDCFVIADAKRGDIGNTSHQYAKAFFETLNANAVTLAPYMGNDSLEPFFQYPGYWGIVLALTSNPGSADYEQKKIDGKFLFEHVLENTCKLGTQDNLMFVVGATKPAEFEIIRKYAAQHFLLVPGVGAQGGSLSEVFKHGRNEDIGLLINASRSIIYASSSTNFAEAAKLEAEKLQKEMAALMQNM